MCSISGWIAEAPLTPEETRCLTRGLLFHGERRGSQSGGIWMDGTLLKKAIRPLDLSRTDECEALVSKGGQWALIHTRQPTSGGRGDEHAQPFVSGDITCVHNGIFTNEAALKEKFKLT